MATLLLRGRHFDEQSLALGVRWNRTTPPFLSLHLTCHRHPQTHFQLRESPRLGLAMSSTSRR
jgi:hypothetical protein